MPSVSLFLEWGGDFRVSPQGGILLATDTAAEATSTIQRIQRLLFTNPQNTNAYGNVIARGDSLFYPTYGAGVPSLVDATMTQSLISDLQSKIQNQLSLDPGIVRNPVPIINVTSDGVSGLFISVVVQTTSGQVVTTPAYDLSGGAS